MKQTNEQNKKNIFMESLRFATLNVAYCKKYSENSGWRTSPMLNSNELFYVKKGCLVIATENGKYFADKNKLFCTPANEYRDIYIERDTRAEFYILRFDSEASGTSYMSFVQSMSVIDAKQHANELDRLFGIAVDIGEPVTHAQVFERIGCAGMILAILFDIAGADVRMPEEKSKLDFSRVMAYIDRFYRHRRITVSELAELINVSEGYFRREFKKRYGISCKMYMDSIRMDGVLKMLRENDAPLKTIAESFQYSDVTYLSRLVKEQTGLSPMEYRKKYKREKLKVDRCKMMLCVSGCCGSDDDHRS